jgi:capsular polysaccharide biosynthesis protein
VLSLEDQIRLINEHEAIVGPFGSALHGILFDISPERHRNIICLYFKNNVDLTFITIDAIKNYTTCYIGAMELAPGLSPRKEIIDQDRMLDLDVTLGGLKELGLL